MNSNLTPNFVVLFWLLTMLVFLSFFGSKYVSWVVVKAIGVGWRRLLGELVKLLFWCRVVANAV